jgi:hypothetical protein
MVIKIGVGADTYAFKFEQSTSLRWYVCLFVRACVRLSICSFVCLFSKIKFLMLSFCVTLQVTLKIDFFNRISAEIILFKLKESFLF